LKQVRILELPHGVVKYVLGDHGVHLPENTEKQCVLFKTHKVTSWA